MRESFLYVSVTAEVGSAVHSVRPSLIQSFTPGLQLTRPMLPTWGVFSPAGLLRCIDVFSSNNEHITVDVSVTDSAATLFDKIQCSTHCLNALSSI